MANGVVLTALWLVYCVTEALSSTTKGLSVMLWAKVGDFCPPVFRAWSALSDDCPERPESGSFSVFWTAGAGVVWAVFDLCFGAAGGVEGGVAGGSFCASKLALSWSASLSFSESFVAP